METLGALLKSVDRVDRLNDHDWLELIEVIRIDPLTQLAALLKLKAAWKSALAYRFSGLVDVTAALPLLEAVLQLGADVNYHEEASNARTPLHHAASTGCRESCELLLRHGADPRAQDGEGNWPVHAAAEAGSRACCEVLLLCAIDGANAQNASHQTALHLAAKASASDCCELLLQMAAQPNIKDKFDITPLHEAAHVASASCCEILLQHGADPNAQVGRTVIVYVDAPNIVLRDMPERSTPLHLAAAKASQECCEILVGYGANLTPRNIVGCLPLDVVHSDDDTTRNVLVGYMYDWDADLFRKFCEDGRTAALRRYLDNFRIVPKPPLQTSVTKVYYHDQGIFYGLPWLPISQTPLAQVLNGAQDVPTLVDHPVLRRAVEHKWPPSKLELMSGLVGISFHFLLLVFYWVDVSFVFPIKVLQFMLTGPGSWNSDFNSFGALLFITESTWFVVLLVSTYCSFVMTNSTAACILSSIMTIVFLLLEGLDFHKRRKLYLRDVTNWINLIAYIGIFVLSIMALAGFKAAHMNIPRAIVLVLLFICALDFLRMVPLTSLLIAITFKMVKDVGKFLALYSVFQIGFSASFYLLFRDDGSRFDTYGEAFLATFLMLFGDFDSDLFLRLEGFKAILANTLVISYLVVAMVMLMNLLIAMMSTSYQHVVDSAKVARTIARAEAILRMETLLPQGLRIHIFKQLCSPETFLRLRTFVPEDIVVSTPSKGQLPGNVVAPELRRDEGNVDGQASKMDGDQAIVVTNTTTVQAHEAAVGSELGESRPDVRPMSNAEAVKVQTMTKVLPARKSLQPKQPNRLRSKYNLGVTYEERLCKLDDGGCLELVESDAGELLRVHHVEEVQRHVTQLEKSIGRLQRELEQERESQRQGQQRLQQEFQLVREEQRKAQTDLNEQVVQLLDRTETIFTKLMEMQQHSSCGSRSLPTSEVEQIAS